MTDAVIDGIVATILVICFLALMAVPITVVLFSPSSPPQPAPDVLADMQRAVADLTATMATLNAAVDDLNNALDAIR
jgi:hypothetical protein